MGRVSRGYCLIHLWSIQDYHYSYPPRLLFFFFPSPTLPDYPLYIAPRTVLAFTCPSPRGIFFSQFVWIHLSLWYLPPPFQSIVSFLGSSPRPGAWGGNIDLIDSIRQLDHQGSQVPRYVYARGGRRVSLPTPSLSETISPFFCASSWKLPHDTTNPHPQNANPRDPVSSCYQVPDSWYCSNSGTGASERSQLGEKSRGGKEVLPWFP